MAHNLVYTYGGMHEDNNLGHKASFKFRLFHLSSKRNWPFVTEYYTHCSVLPTAFKLDLMFYQVPLNGSVNISYSLERKDFLDRHVDAFFSIRISDANGRLIFLPLNSFGKNEMMSGESVRGHITGVIMQPELRNAFNEQMDATIDLLVSFCHSVTIKPAANLNTNENLTPGSKT